MTVGPDHVSCQLATTLIYLGLPLATSSSAFFHSTLEQFVECSQPVSKPIGIGE